MSNRIDFLNRAIEVIDTILEHKRKKGRGNIEGGASVDSFDTELLNMKLLRNITHFANGLLFHLQASNPTINYDAIIKSDDEALEYMKNNLYDSDELMKKAVNKDKYFTPIKLPFDAFLFAPEASEELKDRFKNILLEYTNVDDLIKTINTKIKPSEKKLINLIDVKTITSGKDETVNERLILQDAKIQIIQETNMPMNVILYEYIADKQPKRRLNEFFDDWIAKRRPYYIKDVNVYVYRKNTFINKSTGEPWNWRKAPKIQVGPRDSRILFGPDERYITPIVDDSEDFVTNEERYPQNEKLMAEADPVFDSRTHEPIKAKVREPESRAKASTVSTKPLTSTKPLPITTPTPIPTPTPTKKPMKETPITTKPTISEDERKAREDKIRQDQQRELERLEAQRQRELQEQKEAEYQRRESERIAELERQERERQERERQERQKKPERQRESKAEAPKETPEERRTRIEAEKKRKADERRAQAEVERQRKAEEDKKADEERQRQAEALAEKQRQEAERKRLKDEENERKAKALAEQQREEARIKKQREAEAKARAEERERQRAEEEERQRQLKEAEKKRKAEEAEKKRKEDQELSDLLDGLDIMKEENLDAEEKKVLKRLKNSAIEIMDDFVIKIKNKFNSISRFSGLSEFLDEKIAKTKERLDFYASEVLNSNPLGEISFYQVLNEFLFSLYEDFDKHKNNSKYSIDTWKKMISNGLNIGELDDNELLEKNKGIKKIYIKELETERKKKLRTTRTPVVGTSGTTETPVKTLEDAEGTGKYSGVWELHKVYISKPLSVEKAKAMANKFIKGKKTFYKEYPNKYNFRNIPKQKFDMFRGKKLNDDITLIYGRLKKENEHLKRKRGGVKIEDLEGYESTSDDEN